MTYNVFYRSFGPKGKVNKRGISNINSPEEAKAVIKNDNPKSKIVATFKVG